MTTDAATLDRPARVTQPEPLSTLRGAFGFMSDGAFQLLRHIEVHGPQTEAEVCKAFHTTQRATVKVMLRNLRTLKHLAQDATTKEPTLQLTGRGRAKLADPFAKLARRRELSESTTTRRNTKAVTLALLRERARGLPLAPAPWRQAPDADYWQRLDFMPCRHEGKDHLQHPSRIGNRRYYRDGRVTDLAGNPIN